MIVTRITPEPVKPDINIRLTYDEAQNLVTSTDLLFWLAKPAHQQRIVVLSGFRAHLVRALRGL